MAAAHSSAAQLNNTTLRLATMSLEEKQTPGTTSLAEASISNVASSLMNPTADKESSENALIFAVYDLIALAIVQRPFVFIAVSELFESCLSQIKTPTTQSDATSIIADKLHRLDIAVRSEAKRMASTDHEKTLDVLIHWNAVLARLFHWDEQKSQFKAPLQVKVFLTWLITKYDQGKKLAPRESKLFWTRPRGLVAAIDHHFGRKLWSGNQLNASTEVEPPQSATPVSPALSRQSIEHLVTYTSQEDPLDFLWYDEEEEDVFYIEHSEDEDSHHSNEIFGSASEISGAEVTDSDWSEINCM